MHDVPIIMSFMSFLCIDAQVCYWKAQLVTQEQVLYVAFAKNEDFASVPLHLWCEMSPMMFDHFSIAIYFYIQSSLHL